jgi:hypothetical protein
VIAARPSGAHMAKPSAANIVNPARLPVRARDSVCEQCHLGGERVSPTPDGRSPSSGQRSVGRDLSVYVFEAPADRAATEGSKW